MDETQARLKAMRAWFDMIRKVAPKETQVGLLGARCAKAENRDERRDLKLWLQDLLHQTDRLDEALQLADEGIAADPDDMYAYLDKSWTYRRVDDLDNALA